jgi:hypothetical protein
MCGDDADHWDRPWMAMRGKGFAATCVLRATGVVCRALGPLDGYLDCDEDWDNAERIAAPRPARALLSRWPAFRDVAVYPVEDVATKLPPMLYVRQVSAGRQWPKRVLAGRLAMRTGEHWLVTTGIPGADPAPQRTPDVDVRDSFDASTLAGAGSWGIVTSWYGGCGQGGTTYWNLTVLRLEGDLLVTVAERSLGSVGWWQSSFDAPWGERLIPSLAAPGVLMLDVAPGGRVGDVIEADAGAWQIHDGKFVRATDVGP